MALYFFDIDSDILIRDDEGQEFVDFKQARSEALRRATAYSGIRENLEDSGLIVVTVRDSLQSVALTVRLVWQMEAA